MTIISEHWRTSAFAAASLILAVPMALPAFAQAVGPSEMRAVNEQMQQMQRELDVLQRHVYQGRGDTIELAQAGGPGLADLQLRLDELEARMRDMTGRMEELNHRVTVLNDRLDKFSSDLEFRLNNAAPPPGGSTAPAGQSAATPQGTSPGTSGGGLAGAAPGLTPPAGAGDSGRAPSQSGVLGTLSPSEAQSASTPPATSGAAPAPGKPLPDGSPEEQYKYAFSLLTKSDYAGAERALQAFVAAHPNHPLAGNAQYWLGETYYVRNDFNNAARAFAIGFQKYPKSPKGPDNLLKLGLSLSALNKNKEACQSYSMLKSEFPKAPQEVLRRAEAEQKRLKCS